MGGWTATDSQTSCVAGVRRYAPRTSASGLLQLAGHLAPVRGRRSDHVSPALMRGLDCLDAPAQVVSDLGVTLRQNPMAEALMGVQTGYTGKARSMYYRWFSDPDERRRFPAEDHERYSRVYA